MRNPEDGSRKTEDRRGSGLGASAGGFVLAVVFATSIPAQAAVIEGVRFAPRHERHGVTLELQCTALLRYMYFIKAYVAALYLGPAASAERALAPDVPKRLEIEYFHSIAAADIVRAAEEILERTFSARRLQSVRSRLDRLNALYEDVEPGDRYSLTYVPGHGTELALNGRPQGTIEGADFAPVLFAIWLGDDPLDAGLKDDLLRCG